MQWKAKNAWTTLGGGFSCLHTLQIDHVRKAREHYTMLIENIIYGKLSN